VEEVAEEVAEEGEGQGEVRLKLLIVESLEVM
jgi:hypothetical protein